MCGLCCIVHEAKIWHVSLGDNDKTIDDDIDDNDDDYGGDDDGDGDESFGLPGGVDSIHRAAFVSLELLRLPPILL